MNKFKERVQALIERKELFNKSGKILLGLSGGPDSVALLRVLQELGYSIAAAHCNFKLRGDESERDEQFVRRLCKDVGIRLYVTHFDTTNYAEEHGISIEMAARELRYSYFEKLRSQHGFDVIAIAHHRDDSVETMLLNLIRGTGIKGLTGIQARNGNIVRPMLEVGRADVMSYLQLLNQDYVSDHTNNETVYTRNKIRLKILPLMKEINPSIDVTLQLMSERMLDIENWCSSTLNEAKKRIETSEHEDGVSACFCISAILREPSPRYLLFSLLYPYGFTPKQIDEIYSSMTRSTGSVFYAGKWELLINRGYIMIACCQHTREVKTYCLNIGKPLLLDGKKIEVEELLFTDLHGIPRERNVAALDADKLGSDFFLRRVHVGDRFKPFGMKGSKLVSDYLTDCKRSLFQKRNQYVVCANTGEIAWLIGERIADTFAIDPQKTKRVMLFSWKDNA